MPTGRCLSGEEYMSLVAFKRATEPAADDLEDIFHEHYRLSTAPRIA
jgi:hypothetical protein